MKKITIMSPSLLLAGLSFAVLTMFSSCSAYHNVATWYKYRNDFHLPKEQQAQANTLPKPQPAAEEDAPVATLTPKAAPENQEGNVEIAAAPAVKAPRMSIRKVLNRSRTLVEENTMASAGRDDIQVDAKPIWERNSAQPESALSPQRPMDRPFSIAAILGFIIGALGFLGALAFTSPILFVAAILVAFVLSIIGVTQTGSSKSYRGFGFAILGLIFSALILLAILL